MTPLCDLNLPESLLLCSQMITFNLQSRSLRFAEDLLEEDPWLLPAMGTTTFKHHGGQMQKTVLAHLSAQHPPFQQVASTRLWLPEVNHSLGKTSWGLPGYLELLSLLKFIALPISLPIPSCLVTQMPAYARLLHTGVGRRAGFPCRSEKFLPELWIQP